MVISLFKQVLIEAVDNWLSNNKELIGEKIEKRIRRELRKFSKDRPTIPSICGFALWIFQMMGNLGVVAGVGVDGYTVFEATWERGFDRRSTERLLLAISNTLKLMQIPYEFAKREGWA